MKEEMGKSKDTNAGKFKRAIWTDVEEEKPRGGFLPVGYRKSGTLTSNQYDAVTVWLLSLIYDVSALGIIVSLCKVLLALKRKLSRCFDIFG